MKYCLVQDSVGIKAHARLYYFESKCELHAWIFTHRFTLTPYVKRVFSLHRVLVKRGPYHPLHYHKLYMIGPRICSLGEYIVKHKLM